MSKIWSIFDPFPRPPRDFALDYPKGAQTDSAGNLTRTMDDDEIRARYLVGRRVEGGADEALSPEEFDALATATTGGPAESVASSAIRGDAGRLTTSGYRNPTGIALNRDLPEKKVPRVYAHELGHTVDELAGQIDVKGLDRELRFVYNAGVTGQERTTRQTLPQHVGYKDEDVPREYMAEAIRAYMTDPNWLKSVAPKTAKRIRERVNRDDKLGKIIQFNTLAPAVLGTGAAAALFAPGDANAMDPEIIQGGLMENLGMDEGTAYRYAAVISASPELYDDVLAKIGLSDGFQAKFRAANPRPARYDPEAERKSRQRELDAYQDPIRQWAVETLTGFGVPAFTQYNLLGAAEMAPGPGDVIAVQDAALATGRAYDNPTLGNIGEAAGLGLAAGVGAIPLAGDLLGPLIKTGLGLGTKAAERAVKPGIRAYHGSPHDFDKFSMDKIGTGEGAQAYGHGLYFAEREDTAKFYRDNYAKPPADEFKSPTARQLAQDQLQAWAGDIQGGIEDLRASLGNAKLGRLLGDADESRIADLEEAIAYMERGVPPGRMYEVNIKANPEDFLDWDKPLSEQQAWEKQRQFWDEKLGDPDIITERLGIDPSQDTGEKLVRAGMVGNVADPGMAQRLKEAGIPGIRYLDQGSRAAGEGSRNYVVFDENLIEIVKKYGIAGAAVLLGVSALDVEQAIAENVPQSEWDSLVVGQ